MPFDDRPSPDEIVAAYCADHPRLATRDGSFGVCREVSAEVVHHLTQHGYEALVFYATECRRSLPDAHEKWLELTSPRMPPEYFWVHYVVLCEGKVHDVSFRQFDPGCEHPATYDAHDFMADWGVTMTPEGIELIDLLDPALAPVRVAQPAPGR